MSTKRTRVTRASNSHLRLDVYRENALLFGHTLLGGRENAGDFENDEQRREAWGLHRDRLMAELEPGRRPHAFWLFDRAMPPEAESESHAVWLLPDTSPAERAAIERRWLEKVRGNAEWMAIHGERFTHRFWDHPPASFRAEHEPGILAEVKASFPRSRYL